MNATPRLRSRLVAFALLVVVGCGGQPPVKNDVRDPSVYAKSTRTRVERAVQGITRSPGTAKKEVDRLVATLGKYPNAPVGDNEAIYAELHAAAQALQQKLESRGDGVDAEIERLMEVADRLPTPDQSPSG